eukprot:TRINITY_DN641_c0_g1_i2.p1 TRINITY_DN641_c0_g1~~TRINITY_DN641_c0_g1_i2.p1  ORF type:complete len:438 (-),score=88.65 TRINITY_DN641_c0_g1_i2:247-1560(-)
MAAYVTVDEFNFAAMKAQKESEARAARFQGVNNYNSYTDQTYVVSPGREVRPGGGGEKIFEPMMEKPTLENLDTVMDKGCFNVGVLGKRGCGKSSLINALCGLNDHDREAASVSEFGHPHFIPQSMQRVADPRYVDFVFYDIPAGETLDTEAAAKELLTKLRSFECIMVVSADAFLDVDPVIAVWCATDLKKPCLFVRNKADLAAIIIAKDSSIPMKEAGQKLRQTVTDAFQDSLIKGTGLDKDGGTENVLPTMYVISSLFHSKAARTYHLPNSDTHRIDKSLERMDEDVLQAKLKELYDSFQKRKLGVKPVRSRQTPQRTSQSGQDGDFKQYRDAHQFDGYGRWQPDPGLQEARKLASIPESSAGKNSVNAPIPAATADEKRPEEAPAQDVGEGSDTSSSTVLVKAGSEVKMPINRIVKSVSLSVSEDGATLEIFY